MTRKLIHSIIIIFIGGVLFTGCRKDDDPVPVPPSPPVTPPGAKNCIISGISQRNSGNKPEFGMTVLYDNNLNPTKISIFDSVANTSLFNVSLNYASADSIRIDQYQYMKMDAGKRIVLFVTKSDMTDIPNADDYRYEYMYSADGYLTTKKLYINGSKLANYISAYSYTNGLLTGCVMTAGSSGNLKVLESTLSYNANVSPKVMIYTFPDAFESYNYSAALNFGIRPSQALAQVVTKLYNPGNGALIDTWTSNYSGYSIDSNGYLTNGVASGDLQQGMAAFFGKTYFTYQCQ